MTVFQLPDLAASGFTSDVGVLVLDFGGPSVEFDLSKARWATRMLVTSAESEAVVFDGDNNARRLLAASVTDMKSTESRRTLLFQENDIVGAVLHATGGVDDNCVLLVSLNRIQEFETLFRAVIPSSVIGLGIVCPDHLLERVRTEMARDKEYSAFSVAQFPSQSVGWTVYRRQSEAEKRDGTLDLAARSSAFHPVLEMKDSDIKILDVAFEDGDLVGLLESKTPLNSPVWLFALDGEQPIALAELPSKDRIGPECRFRLELPRGTLYSSGTPKLSLRVGYPVLGQVGAEAPPLPRRFVSAEKLLEPVTNSAAARRRKPFGIVLFTFTRTDGALLIVESLRRQGALPFLEVWMDGDQGNPTTRRKLGEAEALLRRHGVKKIKRHRGNMQFRKLMLHALMHMAETYDRFLVLEDDCFPTHNAVEIFREQLEAYAGDPSVLTVYGHHFKLACERPRCPRFQGWGWSSYSDRLSPFLAELAYLFSIPEEAYIQWTREALTPDIKALVDCTPPRKASDTLTRFFAWDETLCLLAAMKGRWHVPTPEMCVFNFGVGDDSTHFHKLDWYRRPPFNMISKSEVWSVYGA
jgi:hypothetical protein